MMPIQFMVYSGIGTQGFRNVTGYTCGFMEIMVYSGKYDDIDVVEVSFD